MFVVLVLRLQRARQNITTRASRLTQGPFCAPVYAILIVSVTDSSCLLFLRVYVIVIIRLIRCLFLVYIVFISFALLWKSSSDISGRGLRSLAFANKQTEETRLYCSSYASVRRCQQPAALGLCSYAEPGIIRAVNFAIVPSYSSTPRVKLFFAMMRSRCFSIHALKQKTLHARC